MIGHARCHDTPRPDCHMHSAAEHIAVQVLTKSKFKYEERNAGHVGYSHACGYMQNLCIVQTSAAFPIDR